MKPRSTSRTPSGARPRAGADLPEQHALTAALMGRLFLLANGLALAWTLATDSPHMDRAAAVILIAISTALFPIVMWGLFKLPRIAVQLVAAATTVLLAGVIYRSGDSATPLSFLFLWTIPYTLAFFTPRQAAVQIALVALASGAAFAGVHHRVHEHWGLGADEAMRWAFVVTTVLALSALVMRMRGALRASSVRLRQRAAQQATVSEIGQRALSQVGLTSLLNELVVMVSDTLGVDFVTVLELQPDAGHMLMRAGVGWPPGLIGSHTVPFDDRSQAAWAIAGEQPVVVDDYPSETRFRGSPILHEHGVRSGIVVPIRARELPFGALTAHTTAVRGFGDDDVNFLQAVANVLAAAIERRRNEQETRHRALHDPLTGLPNRDLFRDRLQHALARARRRDTTLAVLFLDLDNFKYVNDTLGHEAGDELLRLLAPRLSDAIRAGDTLARFGGDEFVVLCEDIAGEREAVEIAERVRRCFATPVTLAGGGTQHVSASIGVALPSEGHDVPDSLLRDADAAMYRAKQRGRARFEVFDADMRDTLLRRVETEAELRHALEHDELHLVFQPAIEIDSGRLVAVEALARWDHPERGSVPPAEFIPVAEESGLIVPLGNWVIREAMRRAVEWRKLCRPGERPLV
ncbi:MAG TPA: diguanylate cyclase, partial [Thermoleophilaceae bacterium]|nr:diguanylate cyclase [Thermoleophilaceae bacterium]